MTLDERNELIESNLRLAYYCANKYISRYPNLREDIESAAQLGLIKAAKGFKPELGYVFSTYACAAITNEIRMFFKAMRAVKRKTDYGALSLDAPLYESDSFSVLLRDYSVNVEEEIVTKIQLAEMRRALEGLDPNERRIIELCDLHEFTQSEAGKQLGISQTYVSSLRKRGLMKMRVLIEEYGT